MTVPRFLKRILLTLLALAGLFLIFLIHAHITMYTPKAKETLFTHGEPTTVEPGSELSFMTWNLGYAGMGDDMDFFYDGGTQMRTSEARTLENLEGILDFLAEHRHVDFLLLQELDKHSRRSYGIHMPDSTGRHLPEHTSVFASNYRVTFVPVPWHNPMGRVHSGILTASRPIPRSAERYSYPGAYPWPSSLFNLRRGFLLSRYPLGKERELVVINTHKSAFDDGSLRQQQTDFLADIMAKEYARGNYVIAGGDFNQCPPGLKASFPHDLFDEIQRMDMADRLSPGWQYVYDNKVPTNRRAHIPYQPGKTPTSLIDFFIASPNVELLEVEGIHLGFVHSDHNPVLARFRLREY